MQISLKEWYDEYNVDNPEACLGLIQSSNPQYMRNGSTKLTKLYCIGYLVYARTKEVYNGIQVSFSSGSDNFPKMVGLSVVVQNKKNNIDAVRKAVKMLKLNQVSLALKKGFDKK